MYAGYQAGRATLEYSQALILCVVAVTAGASIPYGVSRRSGVTIIARYGRDVQCPPETRDVRPDLERELRQRRAATRSLASSRAMTASTTAYSAESMAYSAHEIMSAAYASASSALC